MARVDFYILADADENRRLHYLCRLTEKAWRLGHRVWIHAPTLAHARALDEWLWTFRQNSFLPHERARTRWDSACPVVIGEAPAEPDERQLLINEANTQAPTTGHFDRVAEVVNQAPAIRNAGRARYSEYRAAGHELHHHRVD